MFGSRDDCTCLINRAARRSSPIRPSSDDEVKPLSTYGQLPFRLAILQENLLRVTLTLVLTCSSSC
ncbi:hypothetical protein DPMN_143142 [Dreissena polymorpha]|uniref:Uncharacterized protein n=1 Tax=Dreissena polymorpha TaxID=45954 RepID=A0A9D4GIK6_DREPO|nr:hypothetical protein DPMN_143142 [Dreissena polymorpha]